MHTGMSVFIYVIHTNLGHTFEVHSVLQLQHQSLEQDRPTERDSQVLGGKSTTGGRDSRPYLIAAHNPHPSSSTTECCLEDDGEAIDVGEFLCLAQGGDGSVRPRDNRHSWKRERDPHW